MSQQPQSDTTRQSHEAILFNLGQSLSAVLEIDDLMIRIVDAAVDLADATEGWIVLAYSDDNKPHIMARRERSEDHTYITDSVTRDPIVQQALQGVTPIRLPDPNGTLKNTPASRVAGPAIYVPLIRKGEARGLLALKRQMEAPPFSEEDETVLTGLSGYAAIAIENAMLYQHALDSNRELSLLVESASAVSFSLDYEEVLDAVSRQMMRVLSVNWCTIATYDEQTQTLRRMAERYDAASFMPPYPSIAMDPKSRRYWALDQGRVTAVYIDHSANADMIRAFLEPGGYSRMLLVPLQIRGKLLGLAEIFNFHEKAEWATKQIARTMRVALLLAQILRVWPEDSRGGI